MSAALIDERGDGTAFNIVHTPTLKREAVVREIVDGESKFMFALEPLLHGLFIVGSDTS
jgi:hypothetical protein